MLPSASGTQNQNKEQSQDKNDAEILGDNSTMCFAPWPGRGRFASSLALSGGYLTGEAKSTARNLNSRRIKEPPEPSFIWNSHSCWSIRSWVKSGHRHFAFWGCQHILPCHIPSALHLAYTCVLLLALGSADTGEAFPLAGSERESEKLISALISQSEHSLVHFKQNDLD